MLGVVPKTFNGATQVPVDSPDYAYVGGGSQHFLIQMTTEDNYEQNAYVGQIAWGYSANDPKIAIRCKSPGIDGKWEHLVRAKDLASHCPYRVGDMFDTTNAQHPASTYLGTQWERYGDGKVIVGLSESETEFNIIGKTGGSKVHALTISEMAPHTHPNGGYDMPGDPNFGWPSGDTSGSNTASNTGITGGGQAHNNMQPYVVAYRWRRIA